MSSLSIINCLIDGIYQMRSLDLTIKSANDEQSDVLKLEELIKTITSKDNDNEKYLSGLMDQIGKFAEESRWWILDSNDSGNNCYNISPITNDQQILPM